MGLLKRRSKFQYAKDRRKAWQKKKRQHVIQNPDIQQAWNSHKSASSNFLNMGLSYDPNKTIAIPKIKNILKGDDSVEVMDIETAKSIHVAQRLEAEASVGEKKIAQFISEDDRLFCIYMLETYKDDMKAMASDRRNVYQLTKRQIARLINKFRESPYFAIYKAAKQSGTLKMDVFDDSD